MLAILVGFALLSAGTAVVPVSAAAQVALTALFLLAVGATVFELPVKPRSLMNTVQRTARQQAKVTPQAREAVERARRRGSYTNDGLRLTDVGLIALQATPDGMDMRRARAVSKDDDGVRPFITLNVDPSESERVALVRFEIVDHTGEEQYIYEMRSYLRDGEMNLLADHHLPLAGNKRISGMGDWDLRVSIDGQLVAMHSFTLAPSAEERRRRLAPDAELGDDSAAFERDSSEEIPLSLEQLLRNQSRGKQGK
jgi:hypothetical protein